MIWESTPKPKPGDTRKFWRFSFFPTKIRGNWYWMEFYEVEQLRISRAYDSWVDNKFYHCGKLIEDRCIPVYPPKPTPPSMY